MTSRPIDAEPTGSMPERADVPGLVDHLFRRQAGRLVATLVRSLGPHHFALAEEAVQDALVQALRRWPFHGVPDDPAAWLYQVARRRALDQLRRAGTARDKAPVVRELSTAQAEPPEARLGRELGDDRLRLIFLCCHPALGREARLALTLKSVAGFGVDEIARALLAKPTTVAQRLVRARRRIRDLALPFEVPEPDALPERIDSVCEVLYLLFNEGYSAHDGDRLIRDDLCAEALRLVVALSREPKISASAAATTVDALAALLHFQASRAPARVDAEGRLVLLDEQDRELWDRRALARAYRHLDRAARGDTFSSYHAQAAIAAEHASSDGPDWRRILEHYDQLMEWAPSPIVALNRVVALAEVRGPEDALVSLERLADDPRVERYHLVHATRAELLRRSGDEAGAAVAYRRALECPASAPERRFLASRLAALESVVS
ncbi:MAG: sigma-70 family RNA polymerase sigma factor [Acidobacteriota bacterium]